MTAYSAYISLTKPDMLTTLLKKHLVYWSALILTEQNKQNKQNIWMDRQKDKPRKQTNKQTKTNKTKNQKKDFSQPSSA